MPRARTPARFAARQQQQMVFAQAKNVSDQVVPTISVIATDIAADSITAELGSTLQAYDERLDAYVSGDIALGIVPVTASTVLGTGVAAVFGDATAGAITITLPPAFGNTGRQITIKKIDASANYVTVDGNGAETIEGSASYDLTVQGEYLTVACDGSGWWITGAN